MNMRRLCSFIAEEKETVAVGQQHGRHGTNRIMNACVVELPLTGMTGSATFEGAKKSDVEEILDRVAACGAYFLR